MMFLAIYSLSNIHTCHLQQGVIPKVLFVFYPLRLITPSWTFFSLFWSLALQNLWFLLDKHQVPPLNGEEAMISYEAYLQVGEKAGPKCK